LNGRMATSLGDGRRRIGSCYRSRVEDLIILKEADDESWLVAAQSVERKRIV
jgi:hypothetical protein